MITITVTIEEVDGSLKTAMDSSSQNPTRCEYGMGQMVETEFKKLQKKLARRTGGKFISGK